MTREPDTLDEAFVDQLEDRGLSVAEIEAASTVAFRYALINRAADVFGFPVPTPEESARLARVLSRMNKRIRVRAPEPLFDVGPDGLWRPADAQAARTQLLSAPGVTSAALRQAAEGFAARWFGADREDEELPEPVLGFVGRVAAFPASMDDAAVEAMRAAGYDDEALFELTMATAMGVACAGVEPLAAVLAGRPNPPTLRRVPPSRERIPAL